MATFSPGKAEARVRHLLASLVTWWRGLCVPGCRVCLGSGRGGSSGTQPAPGGAGGWPGRSGHVLPGAGFPTASRPQRPVWGSGSARRHELYVTHLPHSRVTRVPGTGCSREGLGPVAPELLVGLRPCARAPGAWHVWPRESPLGLERVRPAVPRSPGPSGMQAPWQGAAGAWHLVIKSSGRERSRRCRTVVV